MCTFKVIVAGSRSFTDFGKLCSTLDYLLGNNRKTHQIIIVSGCARGADALGEKYAESRGYSVERYPADWTRYGKRAGVLRNAQMADIADAAVVFWDGKSPGSKNMIQEIKKRNKPVKIILIER